MVFPNGHFERKSKGFAAPCQADQIQYRGQRVRAKKFKNNIECILQCLLIDWLISFDCRLFSETCDMFFVMGTLQLLYGLVLMAVFLFKAEMVIHSYSWNQLEKVIKNWIRFQEVKSFDITLLSPLPSMANCICYVYFYNCFGDETNDSFANISELLYQSDWFRHPQHVQKTLLLMMQNAQQEMFYLIFGGFPLNVDTLGRVSKTSYLFPSSIIMRLSDLN